MDLEIPISLDCFEIRSPECVQLAMNRVIRYERATGNQRKAAEACESLLQAGMVLFGFKDSANQACTLYLADLWQNLGYATEALTLNYLLFSNDVANNDAYSLEIRLRMAELVYHLNVNTKSDLMKAVCILLVEDLLKDVLLGKQMCNHQLTHRVQRQVIRAQSLNMDLSWTLQKYQELLDLGKKTQGIDGAYIQETERIIAHNLQDVMQRMKNESDEKANQNEMELKSIIKSFDLLNDTSTINETCLEEVDLSNMVPSPEDQFLRKSLTAASLLAQGKLHLAVQLYKELLFYTSNTFGDSDQTTLCTKQTLAAVLDQQGSFDEALLNYRETLTTAYSTLGNNHRVTRIARMQMDALTKKLERLNAMCSYYTYERMKSAWFNRIFVLIMACFLLWLLAEVYVEKIR